MPKPQPPARKPGATAVTADEEYELSPEEAPWACALALMTGYSHACCDVHRTPLAVRVADQLAALARTPDATPGLRALLQGLQGRWHSASGASTASPACAATAVSPAGTVRVPADASFAHPRALWHAAPETLQ